MYVCVCLGVNDKAIKAAVEAGATTVEAVTELTCAGSECGSCRPEIASIIEAELANGCARRHLTVVGDDAELQSDDLRSDDAGQQSAA